MEIKEFFEPVMNFIKGFQKKEKEPGSKQAAKDRLKLVLMQDRASVSPDFFDMMKQEIIDVIKKYIEIDEESLEVELARGFEAGLEGPALYANIPIKNVKPVAPKSDENSVLSEEEADKLADEILDNIENVATKEAKDTKEAEADTSEGEGLEFADDAKEDSEQNTEENSETVEKTDDEKEEPKKAPAKRKTTTSRSKATAGKSATTKKTASKSKKEE